MDRGTVNSTRSEDVNAASLTVCVINEARRGMYIAVRINGVVVSFLIDTGAMSTIMSQTFYNRIRKDEETDLQCTNIKLQQADGAPVRVFGTTTMNMQIGQAYLSTKFLVANIQNDGILGMDVLLATKSTIDCDKCELIMDGNVIQCTNSDGGTLLTRQIDVNVDIDVATQVPEFLHDLYEKSKVNNDSSDYLKLAKLLSDYQDVFSRGDHDIGKTDKVRHSIHTTCLAPIRQRPRRSPIGQREEMEKQNSCYDE
eukprot:XP_011682337.1 PREDICTED: uncharacterized protein LOC105446785 isoform X2 [Strongylocentrotus purpuratus]